MAKALKQADHSALDSFGARIAWARERRELTQEGLGDYFNISSQAVNQWEKNKSFPKGPSRLDRLAQVLQVPREWLINGGDLNWSDTALDRIDSRSRPPIPVIDRVAAGSWREVTDPYEAGQGFDSVVPDKDVSDLTFALVIEGNSMLPRFEPGDKVIIDPAVEPRPGKFVVAKLDDDQEATFKKYRLRGYDKKRNPIIELSPLNDDYPTLVIDKDHPGSIVGTMVEHRKYETP